LTASAIRPRTTFGSEAADRAGIPGLAGDWQTLSKLYTRAGSTNGWQGRFELADPFQAANISRPGPPLLTPPIVKVVGVSLLRKALTLSFEGTPANACDVERSSNLMVWTGVVKNLIVPLDGLMNYVENPATNAAAFCGPKRR